MVSLVFTALPGELGGDKMEQVGSPGWWRSGSRVFWNGQKLNISLQAFYDIVRPEFGSEWETRFTVQFVF
jgi:hypothetical protein